MANLQVVMAKLQRFNGEFARCRSSSVVDGCELSDATTWTILLIYINSEGTSRQTYNV